MNKKNYIPWCEETANFIAEKFAAENIVSVSGPTSECLEKAFCAATKDGYGMVFRRYSNGYSSLLEASISTPCGLVYVLNDKPSIYGGTPVGDAIFAIVDRQKTEAKEREKERREKFEAEMKRNLDELLNGKN